MYGQRIKSPSGFEVVMHTNHHLSKPAMIGKLNPDGRLDVVWRSINPIKASVWSRYIPESARLTADWTFPWVCGGCAEAGAEDVLANLRAAGRGHDAGAGNCNGRATGLRAEIDIEIFGLRRPVPAQQFRQERQRRFDAAAHRPAGPGAGDLKLAGTPRNEAAILVLTPP